MRLILLPLGRNQSLVYWQTLGAVRARSTPRIDEKLIDRAAKVWNDFETSDKGWKKTIARWGNRVLEQIPFEESGLKSVPPLGFYKRELRKPGPGTDRHIAQKDIIAKKMSSSDLVPVQFVFPQTTMNGTQATRILATSVSAALKTHLRKIVYCGLLLPLTIPIGLIPVLPNLPAFYLFYRMWSHWEAYRGAQHIESLIQRNDLVPTDVPALDYTYRDWSDQALTAEQADRIFRIFGSPALSHDLTRALHQIAARRAKQDQKPQQKLKTP